MRTKSSRHWVTPLAERLAAKVRKEPGPDGCWIWTGALDRNGYGMIWRGKGQGGHGATHRVAYELAHGASPAGFYVLHRCDTPACCRPDHLFLGTAADNTRDMLAKGRNGHGRLPGERNPIAKLNDASVRAIRIAAANGVPRADLARRYDVTIDCIRLVVTRKGWCHIE